VYFLAFFTTICYSVAGRAQQELSRPLFLALASMVPTRPTLHERQQSGVDRKENEEGVSDRFLMA